MDTGATAWILTSCALVLLMTPALALFYGGMVRRENVLSTIMHSLIAIPVISVVWMLFGYSLAFGESQGGFIGNLEFAGLTSLVNQENGKIPALAFVAFQMMFAVITPALISGAFAERMRFGVYIAFITLWASLVYVPVCHWVWNSGGWLFKDGALDFAGGTVVHITAGVSALVCALVIGKRGGAKAPPHNLTMTVTGAGLLWFGWFGFNAGSALTAGQQAASSFIATHMGAAGGAIAWLVVEWVHRKKPTALGAASGLVAGLVGITPAAGFVAPWAATVIGLAAGAVCYFAVVAKEKLGYDDSLDAFGVHGVGGFIGAVLTGVFAQKMIIGGDTPLGLLDGNAHQVWVQTYGALAAAVYGGGMTFVILKLIAAFTPLRVSESAEREGLDTSLHGEAAYHDAA